MDSIAIKREIKTSYYIYGIDIIKDNESIFDINTEEIERRMAKVKKFCKRHNLRFQRDGIYKAYIRRGK